MNNLTAQAYITRIIKSSSQGQIKNQAYAYAPANIALCKYWGKRNSELNLPTHSSISISLGNLGTSTNLEFSEFDQVWLNGKHIDLNEKFAKKIISFIDFFRNSLNIKTAIKITTSNSVPTAAGFASSASGFAALSLALSDLFALNINKKQLSKIARIGSGSASRSLWHGYVQCNSGFDDNGNDCFAEEIKQVSEEAKNLRIAAIAVDISEKSTNSTDGMLHCQQTSAFFQEWVKLAKNDFSLIKQAINSGNFQQIGMLSENNALNMHALMLSSRPALIYMQAQTISAIHHIRQLRQQGMDVYCTIDAGPNLKILYPANIEEQLKTELEQKYKKIFFINPFSQTDTALQ